MTDAHRDDDLPSLDDLDAFDRDRAADMLDNRPHYGTGHGTPPTPFQKGTAAWRP